MMQCLSRVIQCICFPSAQLLIGFAGIGFATYRRRDVNGAAML